MQHEAGLGQFQRSGDRTAASSCSVCCSAPRRRRRLAAAEEHLIISVATKLEDIVPKRSDRWNFVAASGLVVPPEDPVVARDLQPASDTRLFGRRESADHAAGCPERKPNRLLQVHRPETCYTAGGYKFPSWPASHPNWARASLHANCMDASVGRAYRTCPLLDAGRKHEFRRVGGSKRSRSPSRILEDHPRRYPRASFDGEQ